MTDTPASKPGADLENEERTLAAALKQTPDDARLLQRLGLVVFERGRWAEGTALVERAIALRPDASVYWSNLGEMYRAQRQSEKAEQAMAEAIRLNPRRAAAFANLGLLLLEIGRAR